MTAATKGTVYAAAATAAVGALAVILAGCGGSPDKGKADAGATKSADSGPLDPGLSGLMLSAEPAGAKDALEVRTSAKDGDAVVVEGYIRDWTERMAPFELVSAKLTPCYKNPDETCATPWDFCCEDWKAGRILIDPVSADGKPLKGRLFGEGGLKRNDRVVIKGAVKKDAAGNVTVAAAGIFNKGGGLKE
jgi:hypothetical protein